MGIQGVPAFVFANKYLVSGAQNPATLTEIIDRVAEEENAMIDQEPQELAL